MDSIHIQFLFANEKAKHIIAGRLLDRLDDLVRDGSQDIETFLGILPCVIVPRRVSHLPLFVSLSIKRVVAVYLFRASLS
jgi:hypothetical protein